VTTFRLEGGPFDGQLVEDKAGTWKIWLTTLEPTKQKAIDLNGNFTRDLVSDCFRWVLYVRAGRLDLQGIPVFVEAYGDPDAAVEFSASKVT
jgi:hypothetical protein